MSQSALGRGLTAVVLAAFAGVTAGRANTPSTAAQPPTPTPGVPAGPPLNIAGHWSVTRTYYRRCPACASPIVATVPWVIAQSGATVRVNRGPTGTVTGAGPAYLALEGSETFGLGRQRFVYATLRVAADGNHFAGAFGGSERMANPCGARPPVVTCLVSAGWVEAVRLDGPAATPPAAPATATAMGPLPPVATPSATAQGPGTPRPDAGAGRPARLVFLPAIDHRRQGR